MATRVTPPVYAAAPPPSPERLSVGRKLAFGVGDVGASIVTAINGFFLNAFLLNVAGLRPAAVAAIFLIVKIWDAVNDPVIGALTDRTRTRWGRRRPWLLFAAVPFGLAFWLHWIVPPLGDAGKFLYYLVVALLLDTAYTCINVPYTALTPELSQDYDERTSLNSYRFSFSILGGVIAASLHGTIVNIYPDDPFTGNALSAAIWGFFLTISALITFAFTREHYYQEKQAEKGPGFLEGIKIAFGNRAFVYATAIYLLSWLAIQLVQNNLIFYVDYWVGSGEQFPLLILVLQVANFIFLLMWTAISKRIGKQNVYYIGAAVFIAAVIGLWFVQPGQIGLLFALAIFAAVGVSVAYLIPWSLLPDVIEQDELETGQRREGVFYGFFVFLQKLGLSLGLAMSNLALEATGYITPIPGQPLPQQPLAVLTALRIFVSFVPATILLLSYIPVRLFPITRERHAEMVAELDRRRAGNDN